MAQPVVRVVLGSECWPFTGGVSALEVEADTVRAVIAALDARFPGLGDFVDRRMAFAIDGEIHQDAWFSPVPEGAEVCLVPKIGGG